MTSQTSKSNVYKTTSQNRNLTCTKYTAIFCEPIYPNEDQAYACT